MKKLNKVAYNRLVVQAEEAKKIGLDQVADGVLSSIGSLPREDFEKESYSSLELYKDIYNGLWKIAVNVMAYHDLNKIDASKVDEVISRLANSAIKELELSLDVKDKVGALEPKLPGEKE